MPRKSLDSAAPAVDSAVCLRAGCTAGPTVFVRASADGTRWGYCSAAHLRADRPAGLRRRCPVCAARFDATAAGNGRPATYCTPVCQRAREQALKRAATELARDASPDSGAQLDAQLERAELLLSTWGSPGCGPVMLIGELRDRFWDGSPPPRLAAPSPAAIGALARRVAGLRSRVAERQRQRRKEQAEAQAREQQVAAAAQVGARRVADDAWRRDLLAGEEQL